MHMQMGRPGFQVLSQSWLGFCKLCRHNFEHYRDVPAFENNASIIGIFSKHYQTTSVHKVQTDRKQVILYILGD